MIGLLLVAAVRAQAPEIAPATPAPDEAAASDPRAAAMADGTPTAEVTVTFPEPKIRGKYDGYAYAKTFRDQWRAAGISTCWIPVYTAMGAEPVTYTLEFVVGTDGHASELAVDGVPADVATCLQLRARDWVLPVAGSKPVRISQPVKLSKWRG